MCQKILITILLMTVSQWLLAADKSHYGKGSSISDCVANSSVKVEIINKLTCYNISMLDGIDKLTSLIQLELHADYRETNYKILKPANNSISSTVTELILKGGGWKKSDIDLLAQSLPEITYFNCKECGYYKIGDLSGFKNINKIIIHGTAKKKALRGTEVPEYEVSFDGLPYDQIKIINIYPGRLMSFSCKTLGIWSKKVQMHYSDGYKGISSCYPKLSQVSKLVIRGDRQYGFDNLKEAHNFYYDAFSINPFDQKAISSLSFSFYKLGEYCKSVQVAESGVGLANGNAKTRASILYNLYLARLKMGNTDQARVALQMSNKILPTDHKKKLLKSNSATADASIDCPVSNNWVSTLHNSLDSAAIERSQADTEDSTRFKNFDYIDFDVIGLANGYSTDDELNIRFYDIDFKPGYYGILFKQTIGINRSPNRRGIGLQCKRNIFGGYESVQGSSPGSFPVRESFIKLESDSLPPNYELELVVVFKTNSAGYYYTCLFGGDGWVMDSRDYTAELIRFNMRDKETGKE